jgi:hypothetical protein
MWEAGLSISVFAFGVDFFVLDFGESRRKAILFFPLNVCPKFFDF